MYNVVTTLAPTFLIGPSSFLQVTRTAIKSWMHLKLRKFGQGTTEFAALEHLEKFTWSCDHSVAFTFDWIFFILAGNKGNHKSLNELEFWPHPTTNYNFEFQPDPITYYGVSCP